MNFLPDYYIKKYNDRRLLKMLIPIQFCIILFIIIIRLFINNLYENVQIESSILTYKILEQEALALEQGPDFEFDEFSYLWILAVHENIPNITRINYENGIIKVYATASDIQDIELHKSMLSEIEYFDSVIYENIRLEDGIYGYGLIVNIK